MQYKSLLQSDYFKKAISDKNLKKMTEGEGEYLLRGLIVSDRMLKESKFEIVSNRSANFSFQLTLPDFMQTFSKMDRDFVIGIAREYLGYLYDDGQKRNYEKMLLENYISLLEESKKGNLRVEKQMDSRKVTRYLYEFHDMKDEAGTVKFVTENEMTK